MRITTIGFDADDTLWQNEQFFRITQDRFQALLADHADPAHLAERLLAAERRNLAHYGFGVKGFTLSMLETAIEITERRVPASILAEILEAGRELHAHPIEMLPDAADVVARMAESHRIVLITKGDLFDQERKLAQSGLGARFAGIEIVSDKRADIYTRIFAAYGDGARRAMMVGNSLKSDVIPAIEAGAWGVHVPHDLTWVIEHAEPPTGAPRFRELSRLGDLPDLVGQIESD
ncbi:HAD family hydrolase [Rhodobacteraceae bacterium 2CG4]|uniref:HAD family hydrolase n=1 Tax=Halovulum marinum TaxID=2662447 RepID=A0A6L5Z5K5_9RHOB|nr:HAD family hydrolase [Halovulum marinum]MSU91589.1 HAD family hydrolase [Halovulum marinum]